MLRRCTALALILCFALFSGEALVADVHDGDASAAELLEEGGAHVGTHLSAGIAPGVPSSEPTTVRVANADGSPSGERSPSQPVHSQHACHCVHAHGGVDAAPRPANCAVSTHLGAPLADAMRMPPSLAREPQLRPPIA